MCCELYHPCTHKCPRCGEETAVAHTDVLCYDCQEGIDK
jgi:NMD protein affecting ribosome stability and mRNA decay